MTIPSVTYQIIDQKDQSIAILSPSDLPDAYHILTFFVPIADIAIFPPASYLWHIIELCTLSRSEPTDLPYRTNSVGISSNTPFSEIIYEFFDILKSLSKGYASYDYVITDYVESEMIRLDILVNKKRIDALSQIMHKDDHYRKARATIDNLKTPLPRPVFGINIPAPPRAPAIASTPPKGSPKKGQRNIMVVM
jgi:Membrane GTPase LepA